MARTGEGIYIRKDGRVEGRFIASRDENGKARYKAVYGASKAEVREKLDAEKRALFGSPSPHEGKAFYDVAEEWLKEIKGVVASTTYDRYSDTLERDIYPEYRDTPMKDVTETEINRFLKVAPELAGKRGRTIRNSTLQIIRAVMSSIIQYASESGEKPDIAYEVQSYEELSSAEIEKICLRAKLNRSPEMLSALLALYCGMRIGEMCALSSDDVNLDRMEIYIHCTAHRVRNPDPQSEKKTAVIVEELPRKTQIRRVKVPEAMRGYIEEFLLPGRMLIKNKDGNTPVDPRTLEGRLCRVLETFRMDNINYERLRKTYVNGRADEQVLSNIFRGVRPDVPYAGALDVKWLTEEMARDLAPLRMLMGLSVGEMSNLVGISEGMYRSMENGSRSISWNQYLSLLFLFHYNGRTVNVVDTLGLFPDSLKESLKIGG